MGNPFEMDDFGFLYPYEDDFRYPRNDDEEYGIYDPNEEEDYFNQDDYED